MQGIASSSKLPMSPLLIRQYALYSSSSTNTPTSQQPTSTSTSRRRRRRTDDISYENQDLIGPANTSPDPNSNLRPVIYASTPHRKQTPNSPYSTEEFPAHSSRLGELEMEWRLRRERVDLANHNFWATMNQEFNAQLAHRLAALPPSSDPPSAEDVKRREDTFTQFYADWQASNRTAMNRWVWTWWGEIWAGLKIQSRIYLLRLFKR